MRTYRRLAVRLKKSDREHLKGILSGGVQPVRTVLRALALQQQRPLDGATRGRRSGETTTGSQSGQRNHPAAVAPRRSQAVAGKKCGSAPG